MSFFHSKPTLAEPFSCVDWVPFSLWWTFQFETCSCTISSWDFYLLFFLRFSSSLSFFKVLKLFLKSVLQFYHFFQKCSSTFRNISSKWNNTRGTCWHVGWQTNQYCTFLVISQLSHTIHGWICQDFLDGRKWHVIWHDYTNKKLHDDNIFLYDFSYKLNH